VAASFVQGDYEKTHQ